MHLEEYGENNIIYGTHIYYRADCQPAFMQGFFYHILVC
jgi:hypothetical protein